MSQTFERPSIPDEDYLVSQRVVEELAALNEKRSKLSEFLCKHCHEVAYEHHRLLLDQLKAMDEYAHILQARIYLFLTEAE